MPLTKEVIYKPLVTTQIYIYLTLNIQHVLAVHDHHQLSVIINIFWENYMWPQFSFLLWILLSYIIFWKYFYNYCTWWWHSKAETCCVFDILFLPKRYNLMWTLSSNTVFLYSLWSLRMLACFLFPLYLSHLQPHLSVFYMVFLFNLFLQF